MKSFKIFHKTKLKIFAEILNTIEDLPSVEICRDRHDRRSCKICASCVNFPRKQRDVLQGLQVLDEEQLQPGEARGQCVQGTSSQVRC